MKPAFNHSWKISPRQAMALQRELAPRVRFDSDIDLRRMRLAAGGDVSYCRERNMCFAAIVLIDYRRLDILDEVTAEMPSPFPYVPGLLSFREVPVLLTALEQLPARPDLLVVEGQGRAHPRRLGLASHLGILFDLPAVGVAKTRLIGTHREPARARGAMASLMDNGERIGALLRTRPGVKPIVVSQGHRIALSQALRIALHLTPHHRMPDVLRRAHQLSNEARRHSTA